MYMNFPPPKHNLWATSAPAVTDDAADGYEIGSIWCDSTADKGYLCMDKTAGAAVWQQISGTGAFAPADATYVVGAAHASLSAELVLGTAVIMSGTAAARPAASLAGRLYYSTDTDKLERDNGSSWDNIALAASNLASRYEPMTNSDPAAPEIVFDAEGDVIMVEVAM